VTDDKDERFIRSFVCKFLSPDMMQEGTYYFDETKKYPCPPVGVQEDYKEFIIN